MLRGQSKKRALAGRRILREVGLAERLLYKVNDLSGGQQQRVAIARARAQAASRARG